MKHRLPSSVPCISSRRFTPFLLLFILLLLVYSNSFNASWHLDDQPNITNNPVLKIDILSLERVWGLFFASPGNPQRLYRPLPCLTFALNWYVGGLNPQGYHLVNFGFHLATSWVLYLFIIRLLTVYDRSDKSSFAWKSNVALLATVLWAINPMMTQAVTYIVQRMAIMAAFFYVWGLLSYINARTAQTGFRRWVHGTACLVFFLCAMGSKENAVLFPVSILLVEWIFFRHGSMAVFFNRRLILGVVFSLLLVVLIVQITNGPPLEYVLNGYDKRPFTMLERLMTQPRIVTGYLSQLFLPLPERLSIVHDIVLSTSLLNPWTTLLATAFLFVSIAFAVVTASRFPFLSFAILFYFTNHIVESTILPLELVFEHRNYLPSLFLFLPLAAGLHNLLIKPSRQTSVKVIASALIIMVLFGLGMGTYMRNKVWATEESLWRDAALKAPGSMRPLVTLGVELAWQDHATPDNYRHALRLFERSLNLRPNRKWEKADVLGNMASVHYFQGNHKKAMEIYLQALDIKPEFHKCRSDLIKPMISLGLFDQARPHAEYLTHVRPANPDYQNLLGFIFLRQNIPDKALHCFQSAMLLGLKNNNVNLNTGIALTLAGHWDRGRWFLNQVVKATNGEILPVFAIIENLLRSGDQEGAARYAMKLVEQHPVPKIFQSMNDLKEKYSVVPIDVEMIRPIILDASKDTMMRYR